jgi:putative transposase
MMYPARKAAELAAVRRQFGYRRLLILLRHDGTRVNHKKFRRLYPEELLQIRRRGRTQKSFEDKGAADIAKRA